MIQVQNLSYCYPGGQRALEDISFFVDPGERVGLVGPSGAGKSTLLMHLNGLLPEKHSQLNGEAPIHIGELSVSKPNLNEIRRRVGFLFQDPDDQLFCPTVRDDVAFGPLNAGVAIEEVQQRIERCLRAVDLEGYEHRSTLQLSVGERKRVCLAGVLACEPDVLALDEPSSNLDPRARRQLLDNLSGFAGTQIVATHDLDLVVEHCQRVLVIDQGRLQADGPVREVLTDEVLLQRHGLEVPLRLKLM
ncbi:MAG: cobalt ABC transporter ATP-binding protein [Planctomycetaceae bacterium]|nr:cobalt ABC transporter ATP-binding protein [Planctomycetaceae bacterium]